MLNKLVTKAELSKSRWWRWVLGGLIAIILGFAAWRVARMYTELRDLRLKRLLAKDKLKDLELQKAREERREHTKKIQQRTDRARRDLENIERLLRSSEAEYERSRKAVDKARSWQDLERAVGRDDEDQ